MKLFLLFFTGVQLVGWARSTIIIDPSKSPTLPVLQNFKTNDGRTLNILTRIGSKYENFGTCLLDDHEGDKMDIIIHDHRNAEAKLYTIIKKWLAGGGKRPVNWITLVSCIRNCEIHTLADTIEEHYHKGDSTGDKIENIYEVLQALEENFNDGRSLCKILKMERDILERISHSEKSDSDKMVDCLEVYIKSGEATWLGLVNAVAQSDKQLAKKIAKKHNVSEKDIKDEL